MKLKDVVAQLKEIRDQEVNTVNQRLDPLVFDADRLAFLKFNQLIERWEGEDREFSEEDRVLLKQFSAAHWAMVGRSDAECFMNPYSRATSFFKALAKYITIDLFSATHPVRDPHVKHEPWLGVMVPTLSEDAARSHSNAQFKFRDYQLSSDMHGLVNVISALNNKKNKNKPNHSIEQSVMIRVGEHDDNARQLASIASTNQRTRAHRKTAILQRMRNEEKVVTATYGETGNACLQSRLEKEWTTFGIDMSRSSERKTMGSLEELIAFIVNNSPENFQSSSFLLRAFPRAIDKEVLKGWLAADNVDRKLYDSQVNRVLMYLSIFNYVSFRNNGEEYQSVFGSCSKQDKLSVANAVLNRLSAGESLIAVADFLKSNELTESQKKASLNGSLGVLLKKFFLENPALKPAVESEVASGYLTGVMSVANWFGGMFARPAEPQQPQPAPGLENLANRPT